MSNPNGDADNTPAHAGLKSSVVDKKAWKSLETNISAFSVSNFSNRRRSNGSLSDLYPQPNIPIFMGGVF